MFLFPHTYINRQCARPAMVVNDVKQLSTYTYFKTPKLPDTYLFRDQPFNLRGLWFLPPAQIFVPRSIATEGLSNGQNFLHFEK